jgi:hypothetical protein
MIKKVNQLSKLNRLVHQKLDPSLVKHCRVANYRDNTLILTASTPASGHLLRFQKTDLLTALREDLEWCQLKTIQIQVRPNWDRERPFSSPLPKLNLSSTNIQTVESTASGISFLPLQQALLQLIKHKP